MADPQTIEAAKPIALLRDRMDIQAMRSFALIFVVMYHLWPAQPFAGYIGVDFFFVISGFLITGQLLHMAESPGPFGAAKFYARRVRRLAPASMTVLLASTVATLILVPDGRQVAHLKSIFSSALYVENWHILGQYRSLLHDHGSPDEWPVVGQFWSLSVEEQFYAFWPLIVLVLVTVSARWGRRGVTVGFALISLASFATTQVEIPHLNTYEYFSTFSRIWEFGIGAMLMTTGFRLPRVAAHIAWAAIFAMMAFYPPLTHAMGFPLILPVLASAAVIAADASPTGLLRPTGWRITQWLGDQSYGIYLWQLPVIALTTETIGLHPATQAVPIVAVSILLAVATKKWIEDPIRFSKHPLVREPRVVIAAMVVGTAVTAGAAAIPLAILTN